MTVTVGECCCCFNVSMQLLRYQNLLAADACCGFEYHLMPQLAMHEANSTIVSNQVLIKMTLVHQVFIKRTAVHF